MTRAAASADDSLGGTGSGPPGKGNVRDLIARSALGLIGTALIFGPMLLLGGGLSGLLILPLALAGSLLVVLAAFFDRIDGVVRFRSLEIPIGRKRRRRNREDQS